MENRASIGRSISTSHCYGQYIDSASGDFADYCVDIRGNYTPERATRYLRMKFKDRTITINHVEIETNYYKQDIETFIANSTIVKGENEND